MVGILGVAEALKGIFGSGSQNEQQQAPDQAESNFGMAAAGMGNGPPGIGSRPDSGVVGSTALPPPAGANAVRSVSVSNATVGTLATQLNIAIGLLANIDQKLNDQNNLTRFQAQQNAKQQREALLEGGGADQAGGGMFNPGRYSDAVRTTGDSIMKTILSGLAGVFGVGLASTIGDIFNIGGGGNGGDGGSGSANAFEYAKSKESFSPTVIPDEGRSAIGYGHNINSGDIKRGGLLGASGTVYTLKGQEGKDTRLTAEEAADVLRQDLDDARKIVQQELGSDAWNKLNDSQKDALVSYTMNIGQGNLRNWLRQNPEFKKAILEGRLNDAADILENKGIRTGRKSGYLKGLATRRAEEAQMFRGGGATQSATPGQQARPAPDLGAAPQGMRDATSLIGPEKTPTAITGKGTSGITSSAGPRKAPTLKDGSKGSSLHLGVDIAAVDKTDVYSAAAGVVERAGFGQAGSGFGGYGFYVVIYHRSGYRTLYAHLYEGSIVVTPGDKVTRKQKIGEVGQTGGASGSHLHFAVIDPNNNWVDPTPFLNNPNLLDNEKDASAQAKPIPGASAAPSPGPGEGAGAAATAEPGLTENEKGLAAFSAITSWMSDIVSGKKIAGFSMRTANEKGELVGGATGVEQKSNRPEPKEKDNKLLQSNTTGEPYTYETMFNAAREAAGGPSGKFIFKDVEYQTNYETEPSKPLAELPSVDKKIPAIIAKQVGKQAAAKPQQPAPQVANAVTPAMQPASEIATAPIPVQPQATTGESAVKLAAAQPTLVNPVTPIPVSTQTAATTPVKLLDSEGTIGTTDKVTPLVQQILANAGPPSPTTQNLIMSTTRSQLPVNADNTARMQEAAIAASTATTRQLENMAATVSNVINVNTTRQPGQLASGPNVVPNPTAPINFAELRGYVRTVKNYFDVSYAT